MRSRPTVAALALAAASLAPVATRGQDPAERVAGTLAATARSFDATSVTGAGLDWLVAEARVAHAVLVGESHGNPQTLRLVEHLLRELAAHGFGRYVIENGKVTTGHLARLLRDDGVAAAEAWLRAQPFSMAFLNWREEIVHADAAIRAGYDLVGIDQEFAGSARFLLGRLVELAPDAAARELAAGWAAKEAAAFGHFPRPGNTSRGSPAAPPTAAHAALPRAFPDEPAATIVAELQATARIYALHHAGRHFDNHRERARLMKAHLQATGGSRLVVRLGAMHCGRGHSPLLQLDVGNHLAELAARDGGDTLHVQVLARRSRTPDGGHEPLARAPWLQPLLDAAPDDAGAVFDLRPLRAVFVPAAAQRSAPELCDLVRRYDVAVVFPHFDRCTELVPTPGGR